MERRAPLGEEEERAVLGEVRRLRETPPPTDPSGAGCVAAMVALIAFVFMPVASRAVPVSAATLLAIGAALLGIVIAGALVGVFGGRGARARGEAVVAAAIESASAASRSGDREALRRSAVRMLLDATREAGPVRVRTYDPAAAAARLGEALPYVLGVERLLVERREIEPVFTEPPPSEP